MKNIIFPLLTLFLCILFSQKACSATVKISGQAGDYAHQSITLFVYHDLITEEKIDLGTIQVNSDGKFELTFDITETRLGMADFDGYHGMIYLEPGKNYELVLPPKRTLTETQKRNPFEKPEPIWFGLKNADKNELNYRIQHFEAEFSKLENKYFDQIYTTESKALTDTIKLKLDQAFPKTSSVFYEYHKLYRKATLDFAQNQGKSSDFMSTYFKTNKPQYELDAYSVVFNQVFSNYFETLYHAPNNKKFQNLIPAANLQKLDEYFRNELHFNKELAHFVLLKSLNDAYYSKQFSKTTLLNLLNQVKAPDWSEYEQKTAQLILARLTYLSSGTTPPMLVLKNLTGQKVNLIDYRNKYIYLHFTDPKNIICKQHLDALKTIADRYKEKLIVITVIRDAIGFKNEKGWSGIFATTETNPETSYKVKTFPTSFLIGKDGRLLLSPAPNPIDGFDRIMGQIMKSDYMKEMQKSVGQSTK